MDGWSLLASLIRLERRPNGELYVGSLRVERRSDGALVPLRVKVKEKWSLERMNEGYKAQRRFRVYLPTHPRANKAGYVLRSIAAYEAYHKVEVTPREIIHHRDGDTLNDSESNLQSMTRSEHQMYHTDNWGFYHRS